METPVLGVIRDSSVAIEAERDKLDVAGFLKRIAGIVGERQAALCSISVAELAHGIYRANTSERRERRRVFLDELKATVPVYPITASLAQTRSFVYDNPASCPERPSEHGRMMRDIDRWRKERPSRAKLRE